MLPSSCFGSFLFFFVVSCNQEVTPSLTILSYVLFNETQIPRKQKSSIILLIKAMLLVNAICSIILLINAMLMVNGVQNLRILTANKL